MSGVDGRLLKTGTVPTNRLVQGAELELRDGSVPWTGDHDADGNRLTGLPNAIAADEPATKGQLDSAISGFQWQKPVDVFNLIANETVANINGLTPALGDDYVVTDAGTLNPGSLAVVAGDLVEFDGTNWILIVGGSGGFVAAGVRALITRGTPAAPYAGGDKGKIATFDGASNTGALTTSLDGWALTVKGEGAQGENRSYTFDGVVPTGDWILTGSGVALNTTNGTIQDVGTANLAGNSTLAAAANHSHRAPHPARADKFVASAATSGNFSSTAVAITSTPALGSYVDVQVDGVSFEVGDGVKTKDCYFSGDGGTTARAITAIVATDVLYWNGVIAGFDLLTSNKISLNYLTFGT